MLDDAGPANAHHLRQDAFDVLDRLQGLGQNHAIKLSGGEDAEPLVQVGLDHIQAARDASQDLLFIQFDPDQAAVVRLAQPGQESA